MYHNYKLEYLSATVEPTPDIAILEAKKEVLKMSNTISDFLTKSENIFISKKEVISIEQARKIETLTDQMQIEI